MSNINKQGRQVQRYANYGVDMMEWADGGYVKHSDYLALLDELEAKDRRIAKLSTDRARGVETLQSELIQARIRAEAAEKRIAELEAKLANPVLLPKTNGYWTEQEKAYEEAITFAKRQVRLAGFRCEGDE